MAAAAAAVRVGGTKRFFHEALNRLGLTGRDVGGENLRETALERLKYARSGPEDGDAEAEDDRRRPARPGAVTGGSSEVPDGDSRRWGGESGGGGLRG